MAKPSDICILLVDDEEGIRESIGMNLELEDFKVLTATGGYEAIEVLKNNKIDFVVSDIRMPKGDGVILLKYIKENVPDVRHIILMSGFAQIEADEVKSLGGIDLLLKPPDLDELIVLIKKHCNCQ